MARAASITVSLCAMVALAHLARTAIAASAADELVLSPYLTDDRQRLPVMDGPSVMVGASACFVMDDGDIFVSEAPPAGSAPSSDGTWALDSKERFYSVPSGLKGTRFVGARSWGHLFGLTDAGEIVVFFHQANEYFRRGHNGNIGCGLDSCPFVAGVLPGPYMEIAPFDRTTLCAIRASDGEVQCYFIPPQVAGQRPSAAPWVDLTGLLGVPAGMCNTPACATTDGPYTNVKTTGAETGCALRRSDGTVRCWGKARPMFLGGILPYTDTTLPVTTGMMRNGQNPAGWPRLSSFMFTETYGGYVFMLLPQNRSELPKYGINGFLGPDGFEGGSLPTPVPLIYTGGESGFIGGNRGIDARGGFWSSFLTGNRDTWSHCNIPHQLRARFDCGEHGPVTFSFENLVPVGVGNGGAVTCVLQRNSNLPECDAFIGHVDSAKQDQRTSNYRAFWPLLPGPRTQHPVLLGRLLAGNWGRDTLCAAVEHREELVAGNAPLQYILKCWGQVTLATSHAVAGRAGLPGSFDYVNFPWDERPRQLVANHASFCLLFRAGLRNDTWCWPDWSPDATFALPSYDRYDAIAMGGGFGRGFVCGVPTSDPGRVECDGAGDPTTLPWVQASDVPAEASPALSQIVAGRDFACMIATVSGQLWCIGAVANLSASATAQGLAASVAASTPGMLKLNGPWGEAAAGPDFVCLVRRTARTAVCLGPAAAITSVPSSVAFSLLTAGAAHACGLVLGTGRAVCWGDVSQGSAHIVGPAASGKSFTHLVATRNSTCGGTASGTLQCFGFLARYHRDVASPFARQNTTARDVTVGQAGATDSYSSCAVQRRCATLEAALAAHSRMAMRYYLHGALVASSRPLVVPLSATGSSFIGVEVSPGVRPVLSLVVNASWAAVDAANVTADTAWPGAALTLWASPVVIAGVDIRVLVRVADGSLVRPSAIPKGTVFPSTTGLPCSALIRSFARRTILRNTSIDGDGLECGTGAIVSMPDLSSAPQIAAPQYGLQISDALIRGVVAPYTVLTMRQSVLLEDVRASGAGAGAFLAALQPHTVSALRTTLADFQKLVSLPESAASITDGLGPSGVLLCLHLLRRAGLSQSLGLSVGALVSGVGMEGLSAQAGEASWDWSCGAGISTFGARRISISGSTLSGLQSHVDGGAALCVRSGAGSFTDVVVEDTIISGVAGAGSGGAMLITSPGRAATVSLRNVTIRRAFAGAPVVPGWSSPSPSPSTGSLPAYFAGGSRGGCVLVAGAASVSIADTAFAECSAAGDGGALAAVDVSSFTVITCSARSCDSGGSGGGLFVLDAPNVHIQDSSVINASAAMYGGGASVGIVGFAPLVFRPVITGGFLVQECSAGIGGGGLHLYSAPVTTSVLPVLQSLAVESCASVSGIGGGLLWQLPPGRVLGALLQLEMRDCFFSTCRAASGGGMHIVPSGLVDALVQLSNVTLRNNSASGAGGAAFMGQMQVNAAGLALINNSAAQGAGGGLYLFGCELSATALLALGNVGRQQSGGALLAEACGPKGISVLPRSDTASAWAGLLGSPSVVAAAAAVLLASTDTLGLAAGWLSNNTAGLNGGVIQSSGCSLWLERVVASHNSAASAGGALSSSLARSFTPQTLREVAFLHNTAHGDEGGGAILARDTEAALDLCDAWAPSAAWQALLPKLGLGFDFSFLQSAPSCVFVSNRATKGPGGDIRLSKLPRGGFTQVRLGSAHFANSSAAHWGGSVLVEGADEVSVVGVAFSGTAVRALTRLDASRAYPSAPGDAYANRTVDGGRGNGGALAVISVARLALSNVSMSGCAADYGGALWVDRAAGLSLSRALFAGNVARYAGPSMLLLSGQAVSCTDSCVGYCATQPCEGGSSAVSVASLPRAAVALPLLSQYWHTGAVGGGVEGNSSSLLLPSAVAVASPLVSLQLVDVAGERAMSDDDTECLIGLRAAGDGSDILLSFPVTYTASAGVIFVTPFAVAKGSSVRATLRLQCTIGLATAPAVPSGSVWGDGLAAMLQLAPVLLPLDVDAVRPVWLVRPPAVWLPSSTGALSPVSPMPRLALVASTAGTPMDNCDAVCTVSIVDGPAGADIVDAPSGYRCIRPDALASVDAEGSGAVNITDDRGFNGSWPIDLPDLHVSAPLGSSVTLGVRCTRGLGDVTEVVLHEMQIITPLMQWGVQPPAVLTSRGAFEAEVRLVDSQSSNDTLTIDSVTTCTLTAAYLAGESSLKESVPPVINNGVAGAAAGRVRLRGVSVLARLGSTLELTIQCSTGSEVLPSRLSWTAAIDTCGPGSAPAGDGFSCGICPATSYSLGGARALSCTQCPRNGVTCLGGALYLLPGYYRHDDGRDVVDQDTEMHPCWRASGCTVNQSATDYRASTTHGCAEGYSGPLCGVCQPGFASVSRSCVPCWPAALSRSVIFLLPLSLVVFAAYIVRMRRSDKSSPSQVLTRIVLTYVQTLGVLGSAYVAKGTQLFREIFGFSDFVGDGLMSVIPVQCELRPSYYAKFALTMALPFLIAILCIGVGVGIIMRSAFVTHVGELTECGRKGAGSARAPRNQRPAATQEQPVAVRWARAFVEVCCPTTRRPVLPAIQAFASAPASAAAPGSPASLLSAPSSSSTSSSTQRLDRQRLLRAPAGIRIRRALGEAFTEGREYVAGMSWLAAVLFVFAAGYASMTNSAFMVFNCLPYRVGGVRYHALDLTVSCDDEAYGAARISAGIMLALFGLGFPALFSAHLYRNRKLLGEPAFFAVWGFLYDGYGFGKGKHTYMWESVVMVRKALVVSIGAVVSDGWYQLCGGLLLMTAFLAAHATLQPYTTSLYNVCETLAITGILATQILSAFYLRSEDREALCIGLPDSSTVSAPAPITCGALRAETRASDLGVTTLLTFINSSILLLLLLTVVLLWAIQSVDKSRRAAAEAPREAGKVEHASPLYGSKSAGPPGASLQLLACGRACLGWHIMRSLYRSASEDGSIDAWEEEEEERRREASVHGASSLCCGRRVGGGSGGGKGKLLSGGPFAEGPKLTSKAAMGGESDGSAPLTSRAAPALQVRDPAAASGRTGKVRVAAVLPPPLPQIGTVADALHVNPMVAVSLRQAAPTLSTTHAEARESAVSAPESAVSAPESAVSAPGSAPSSLSGSPSDSNSGSAPVSAAELVLKPGWTRHSDELDVWYTDPEGKAHWEPQCVS